MKLFNLAPADGGGTGPRVEDSRGITGAVLYGSLSFGVVSVLAYTLWAFRLVPGTAALYTTTAAVYIGLGGLVLGRLINVPAGWKRFPLLFATVFFIYAFCWCAFWFGLQGKYLAD